MVEDASTPKRRRGRPSAKPGPDAAARLEPIPARRALVPIVEATAFFDQASFGENQLSRRQLSTENRATSKPAKKSRGRSPTVRQAQALLREQLADGPKPGELVEAAAEAAAIPERSLIRAADVLNVRTQRGQWWLPG